MYPSPARPSWAIALCSLALSRSYRGPCGRSYPLSKSLHGILIHTPHRHSPTQIGCLIRKIPSVCPPQRQSRACPGMTRADNVFLQCVNSLSHVPVPGSRSVRPGANPVLSSGAPDPGLSREERLVYPSQERRVIRGCSFLSSWDPNLHAPRVHPAPDGLP